MLKGKLIYVDEHLGEVSYEVYGRETFNDLRLFLQNDDITDMQNHIKASKLYDKVIVPSDVADDNSLLVIPQEQIISPYPDASDFRRLDIKKSNKYKTNMTNRTFATRVSALVRYAEITGKKNYNNGTINQDHFETERLVHLGKSGYVRFAEGLVTEMNIKNKYVQLILHTVPDKTVPEGIFQELKVKDKFGNIVSTTPISTVGFKLNEETLGFPYTSRIVEETVNLFGMYDNMQDVLEAHPDKNTLWMLERNYTIVTDEILDDVMKEFNEFDGWIAFDTETTGLNINFKSRTGDADELVGVVLSKEIGTGYYFPLQQKLFPNLCNGDHWYFMEKYMKTFLETKKIICHNLQFDWKVAYIYDINVNCLFDTLLAFGVTKRYENPSYKLGLKTLVKNLFGLDMLDLGDFVYGTSFSDSNITFADLPYELVKDYAPTDGDMTLSLAKYIEETDMINKYDASKVLNIEVNFAKAVSYAEFFGYHIDTNKVPEMHEKILENMKKYSEEMFAIAGREFNPNSPQQLMTIMYDELKIEQTSDKRSSGKEVIATLKERTDENGNPKYPFVIALEKYRQNEGIYKNFLKRLHEFATPDGFIFSNVGQLGTDTGRTTAKDPNYQSYNDAVKKNVTPRRGYIHFDCDFSQIEYRVLASMAKQEQLIRDFADPDLDYHTYQASRMFSVPYALVSKALRSQSKGINFGLPYGMGDSSLGARIFGERTKATYEKAKLLRRKFFQGQEDIELFFKRVRDEGVQKGYTSTFFGRRRYYDRGTYSEGSIRRQAGNHVIQGTAADIYKLAVNRLFNRIVDEGWLGLAIINVFVHDELLVEVHESINPLYWLKAWREEFQLTIDGFCPLYAGAGWGKSWYEAKAQDLPVQFIDELVNSYSEGMDWHEDADRFLKDVNQMYADYKVRRVKDFILDPQNQGEIIKPIINSLLVEVTDKALNSIRHSSKAPELIKEYNEGLGKPIIPEDESAKVKVGDLKNYIFIFSKYYGYDMSGVDIKSPSDAQVVTSTSTVEAPKLEYNDDEFSIADYVTMKGYYKDPESRVIYFIDRPMTYNGVNTTIQHYLAHTGEFKQTGIYKVGLFNEQTRQATVYNAYLDDKGYNKLVQVYSILNRTRMNFAPMSM